MVRESFIDLSGKWVFDFERRDRSAVVMLLGSISQLLKDLWGATLVQRDDVCPLSINSVKSGLNPPLAQLTVSIVLV